MYHILKKTILSTVLAASLILSPVYAGTQMMTVTAELINNGPDEASFNVSGYTGTYDGKSHTALTATIADNSVITYSKDGVSWTNTAPTVKDVADSGTYYVKATLNDRDIVKTVTVTVNKNASASIKAKAATKVSGENDPTFTATASGMVSGETFDYSVVRTDTSEAVGTHKNVLVVQLNKSYPNYNIQLIPANLTITESDYDKLKKNFKVEGYEGVYDGAAHGVTVKGTGEATVKYSSDGSSWSTSSPKIKDVKDSGTVRVKATINGKSIEKEADVKITPASATIVPSAAVWTLGTTEPQYKAVTTGFLGSDKVTYEVYRLETDTDTVGVHKGVLLVRLTSQNANYSITTGTGDLTIKEGEKKESPASDNGNDKSLKIVGFEGEYDGKTHTITVTGTKEKVEYSVDGGKTFSETKPHIKDAADSKEIIIKVGDKTYKESITILPRPIYISCNNATKAVGEKDPVVSATVDGLIGKDSLTYETYIDKKDKSYPTPEKAGIYKNVIKARVTKEDPNYNPTVIPGTLTITEGTKVITLNDVKIKGFIGEYDGQEHTIRTNISDNRVNIEYSVDGKSWTKKSPVVKNTFDSVSVNVLLRLGTSEKKLSVSLNVLPRKATISVNDVSKKSGDDDPEFTAVVSGLVSGESFDYTVSRLASDEDPEAAGKHTLTANLAMDYPNYDVRIINGTLTIERPGLLSSPAAKATIGVLTATGVGAAVATTGGFNFLWMLLLTLLFRNKRKKWHGILTEVQNKFIETVMKSGSGELVQDVIDKTNSPQEALELLKLSEDMTYLPVNTKMEIFYIDGEGDPVVLERKADEDVLYKDLEELVGAGEVNVTLINSKAKFEIPLVFHL